MMADDKSPATPSASGYMPDEYDRIRGQLDGLPGLIHAKPAILVVTPPLGVGGSRTYMVQTYRQRHEPTDPDKPATFTDTVFLEVTAGGMLPIRLAIPHKVVEMMARQRDSLFARHRSVQAKRVAKERKARGVQPAFLRSKGKKG